MNATHSFDLSNFMTRLRPQRGLAFGLIIILALLSFEIFNYSTTDFALRDLLGTLDFMGISWATILAIAFCGIDFAGIARLFTPGEGSNKPDEVWYLFGAWLLAATMNAMLTWWGVSIAILNHNSLGSSVIARATLVRVAPIFVALLVWLIRVLIIGAFSSAGNRLFSQGERPLPFNRSAMTNLPANRRPVNNPLPLRNQGPALNLSAAPRGNTPADSSYTRPEPTYHPTSMSTPANSNSIPLHQ